MCFTAGGNTWVSFRIWPRPAPSIWWSPSLRALGFASLRTTLAHRRLLSLREPTIVIFWVRPRGHCSLVTGGGISHVQCYGALDGACNWFAGSVDSQTHVVRCGCRGRCSCILGLQQSVPRRSPAVSRSPWAPARSRFLAKRGADDLSLTDEPSWSCGRSALSLLQPFAVAAAGWGLRGFVGRMQTTSESCRGEICLSVHLGRLIARIKKASLDVHDITFATGRCIESANRIARVRSVASFAGASAAGPRSWGIGTSRSCR